MDKAIAREVKRLRDKGWKMDAAYQAAKVRVRFEELADAGLVALRIIPDDDYDDSYIDTWGLSANEVKTEKKKLWTRIGSEGVWSIVGEICVNGRWETTDSCCGFIGDDYIDCYDLDIMMRTIEALTGEILTRYENHATFAG